MKTEELYRELETLVATAIAQVEFLKLQEIDVLNKKSSVESWSALACLVHLNQYAAFYLPEMERVIQNTRFTSQLQFKPGILGNYFANSMRVNSDTVKKMKSPKDKTPLLSKFDFQPLQQFENDLHRLQRLIRMSHSVDLKRTKCSISLTRLIKLSLGDTLLFYTLHIERHLWQAKRAMR